MSFQKSAAQAGKGENPSMLKSAEKKDLSQTPLRIAWKVTGTAKTVADLHGLQQSFLHIVVGQRSLEEGMT